jgi:transposase
VACQARPRVRGAAFREFESARASEYVALNHSASETPNPYAGSWSSCYQTPYAEATRTQQIDEWVSAHTRMLEYFGGSTAIWVPDQLKSAVTRPCRYEAGVNRSYQDLAHHYGAVVIPARPREARDKAKVESAVLVAQRWILARLRNRTFFSLEELNAAIRVLLDDLNDRPMQKIGKSRRELWEALDRPALTPLPASRYELARWKVCRANIDYHVEVERHFYSVPHQLAGTPLEARYTDSVVEVYLKDRRVASHIRRYDHKPSTVPDHTCLSADRCPARIAHTRNGLLRV